jgi:hypothetical protein
VPARLTFPQPNMLAVHGGESAMSELPLINELLAKRTQDDIVRVLKGRFGKVPAEVIKQLRSIVKERQLKQLIGYAVTCPDLSAFRDRLPS